MKIACLIGRGAQHIYFVNRIRRRHPIALVVSESASPTPLRETWNRLRTCAAMGAWGPMGGRPPITVRSRRSAAICDRLFGSEWRALAGDIPLLTVDDINSPQVLERLAAERPDVLIDHGTSIVQSPILGAAPLALNLHWGLSPYYRGTHCTEWALINGDPHNIGVTIHRLDRKIDGGDILAQRRLRIEPDDGVETINMKLTREGAELVVAALDRLAAGGDLRFAPQDFGQGHLLLRRHWSRHLRRHVQGLIRSGALARMVEKPTRRELPIIEM